MADKNDKANEQQAKVVQSHQALLRKFPDVPELRLDSIDELLVSTLMDALGKSFADCVDIIRELRTRFIDWNELRVTRMADLARKLDEYGPGDDLARRLRTVLGKLFDRVGRVSFYFLAEMKPMDARRALGEIDNVNRDAAGRILMLENPEASFPFTDEAFEAAKKLKLIDAGKTKQQLQKLLEDSLGRETAIECYYLLEAEAHGGPAVRKPKTTIDKKPSKRISVRRMAKD